MLNGKPKNTSHDFTVNRESLILSCSLEQSHIATGVGVPHGLTSMRDPLPFQADFRPTLLTVPFFVLGTLSIHSGPLDKEPIAELWVMVKTTVSNGYHGHA